MWGSTSVHRPLLILGDRVAVLRATRRCLELVLLDVATGSESEAVGAEVLQDDVPVEVVRLRVEVEVEEARAAVHERFHSSDPPTLNVTRLGVPPGPRSLATVVKEEAKRRKIIF